MKKLLILAVTMFVVACSTVSVGSNVDPNVGNGVFLGEGVRSGTPSWDDAYIRAGGKFL